MKILGIAAALGLGTSACMAQAITGSGKVRSQTRSVGHFSKIDIGGAWQVEVKIGPRTSVKIETDDNLLRHVQTKVQGDTLHVAFDRSVRNAKSMKLWITTPNLNGLDLSGASNAVVEVLSGWRLDLDCSGASHAKLKGRIDSVVVDASGASNEDLLGAEIRTATVDASGASNVRLKVREKLRVDASGASSVQYKGRPSVQRDLSGASSVKSI